MAYLYSERVLLENLRALAEELEKTPTAVEMAEYGPHSPRTYQDRFDSWNESLRRAGLEINAEWENTEDVECDWCGSSIPRKRYDRENHEYHFCNDECMGKWESKHYSGEGNPRYNSTEVDCYNCRATLKRPKWLRRRVERHFCDNRCRTEAIRDEKFNLTETPTYSGYGRGWTEQTRESVRVRDGRTCQACGKTEAENIRASGCKLHVHHIFPATWFEDPDKRNGEENLVSLCNSCHKKWEGIPLRPSLVTKESRQTN